jgi:8-oxo-dGTP pyrophosphatase MutT (NUDIX family)
MSTEIWLPESASAEAIPWSRIQASLRIPQRWPEPHLLYQRVLESRRRAAVAVLLWGDPGGAREVVLVQRGATAPRHGGELAFPGGMVETFDRDLPATALRELREEIGVDKDLWELGTFPDGIAKGRTRFTPVFLRWEAPEPRFQVGSEIQDVLRLPLAGLLEAPWRSETLTQKGVTFQAPRLELPLAPLWGATAMVLKAWLNVLSTVPNS